MRKLKLILIAVMGWLIVTNEHLASTSMESAPKLTCGHCKSRNINCDKISPCTACTTVEVDCEPVQRARLPHANSGALGGSNQESRIARIKNLQRQSKKMSDENVGQITNDAINQAYPSPTGSCRVGEFVAPSYWTALSAEVDGLRETVDNSDVYEPYVGTDPPASKPAFSETTILFGMNPHYEAFYNSQRPVQHEQSVLLDLYKQRVDSVYKILHWPTLLVDLQCAHGPGQSSQSSSSTKALEFAIYFMALCTITDSEAMELNLGCRSELIRKYQLMAELYISEAGLIRVPNLTVLQAFVIYLIGLRACQNSASKWTLLAVAVRIANALRLGQENPQMFSAFDLELRRRLWYCIGLLDTLASFDRGTTHMVQYADLGIAPLVINDKDMSQLFVPQSSSYSFSAMSFFALMLKSMVCYKKMLAMPSATEEQWREKLLLVMDFEKSMQKSYCNINDSAQPLEKFAKLAALEIIAGMHLLLRRPTYRSQQQPIPSWDVFNSLESATVVLERSLQVKSGDLFAPWAWKSWVHWHALAVVLAELLSQPRGPGSERAYLIAVYSFDHYRTLIADSEFGIVWRPIAKMMHRVQQVRQGTQQLRDTIVAETPLTPLAYQDTASYPGNFTGTFNPRIQEAVSPLYMTPDGMAWPPNMYIGDISTNESEQMISSCINPELIWSEFLDDLNLNYSVEVSSATF